MLNLQPDEAQNALARRFLEIPRRGDHTIPASIREGRLNLQLLSQKIAEVFKHQ